MRLLHNQLVDTIYQGAELPRPSRPSWRSSRPHCYRPAFECLQERVVPAVTVRGDFNGDGYGDLAIGVPGEDLNGRNDVGAVQVIYGSATGLRATGNQLWHQNSPGVENSNESGDRFGSALAVGDFNGDGYEDLAIGVPYEDVGSITDAGAVNILFGSPGGLSATFVPDQCWTQAVPGTKHKSGRNDHYGFALATADFNGDGFVDLAIGVPDNSAGKQDVHGAGGVSILFGTRRGLTATTPDDQWFDMLTPGILGEPRLNDNFGYALAAGDFNGDGHPELAVGIPLADAGANGNMVNAGAVSLIYGSATGLRATGNQLWYQGNSGVRGALGAGDTVNAGDQFGSSLAVGNFDGDARADLAIGVPFEDGGPRVDAGAVQVLFGSGTGLTGVGGQFWTQDQLSGAETAEARDQFGASLACADFNSDGRSELVVGVPNEDLGTIVDAGVVHVLFGSPNGLTATAAQLWSQNNTGSSEAAEAGDLFGSVLVIGDFNGDGRRDLAIGVPNEDLGGMADSGLVQVLYSSSAGLTSAGLQLWTQDSPTILDAAETGDGFGAALGHR